MEFTVKILNLRTVFLGFILCFSTLAWAVDPAGKVIRVEGTVVAITEANATRVLQRGDNIFAKETIKTDAKSTIVMRYTDGSIVQLQKSSSYIVHDFQYAEDEPKKDNFSAELLKGGFRTITGQIGSRSPQNYEVRARQTTLTVRGTEYEGVLPPCPSQEVNKEIPCLDCLWHVTLGTVSVNFEGNQTILVAGTESAAYMLKNGVVTLGATAPAGTGNAPYGNVPLKSIGSGVGAGPCSELEAIGVGLSH